MAHGLSVDIALCAKKISSEGIEADFQHHAKDVCRAMGFPKSRG